jgi:glutathione synthase/RimK-type ligase-like ATP-grasp enzyme
VPNIERYVGKIVQMTIAKTYFNVPNWSVELNNRLSDGICVAKSLSTALTSNNKIIYTTKVIKEKLDVKYPWYLQDLIEAELDITIVYIDGKSFAYELMRKKDLIDWRKEINKEKQEWKIHEISIDFENAIIAYMSRLSLKFGRLDFLFNSGNYYFLEVNPNGQWAWLDLENKNGLMTEMITQISPITKVMATTKTCP